MKTIVIVGAGKLLGLSLARKFGQHDFQIALIARNEEKLSEMKAELEKEGINVSYFLADIYDKEQIERAFQEVHHTYGEIDVLEFSPTAGHYPPASVLDLKPEQAQDAFIGNVLSAIRCVNEVLPYMLKRQNGALLFTTGLSAFYPNPQMADSSIAKSGLRSYIRTLQDELVAKNIFVGHISLGVFLKAGTGGITDPDSVAEFWYEKYSKNLYGEELYPNGVTPETVVRS